MPRPYLQFILAVLLVVIVSYLWTPGKTPDAEVSAWQKSLPRNYLINAKTSNYSEEGDLEDVMQADSASYYPNRKESIMVSPRVYSHNLDDDTWSAASDNGRFDHKREVLVLTNNVVLSNDNNNAQLDTERMKIDFRTNTATSRVPVKITNGENSTDADGMVADLDTQTVRLQPNVESTYVQPAP